MKNLVVWKVEDSDQGLEYEERNVYFASKKEAVDFCKERVQRDRKKFAFEWELDDDGKWELVDEGESDLEGSYYFHYVHSEDIKKQGNHDVFGSRSIYVGKCVISNPFRKTGIVSWLNGYTPDISETYVIFHKKYVGHDVHPSGHLWELSVGVGDGCLVTGKGRGKIKKWLEEVNKFKGEILEDKSYEPEEVG